MDGLAKPAGSGIPIKFNGEDLVLDALGIEDLGVIENHLLSKRKNPLDVAKQAFPGLPPELAEKLLERAYTDALKVAVVTTQEVFEYIDTLEGMRYTIWLALEKRYPGRFSLDKIGAVLDQMDDEALEELKNKRAISSGLDQLGN